MEYKSLYQFFWEKVRDGEISEELLKILQDISLGIKVLNKQINIYALFPDSDPILSRNYHGERQHKLDVLAHNIFLNSLQKGGVCNHLISEEAEDLIELGNHAHGDFEYTVCIDPLDGSSNIDSYVSVGTIFSIFRDEKRNKSKRNTTRLGRTQVAAGYAIYGTTTMLVLTVGKGVYGFSLDLNIGEFLLTHANLKISKTGNTYSVNEANYEDFPIQIREYLTFCKKTDQENLLPYKSRYIGSMVADIHRTLLNGGIFLYPSTKNYPHGKLRLLYECFPVAFIFEQAGGLAIDGIKPILDVSCRNYHQKVPFIAGSFSMVKKVLDLYKNESIKNHLYYSC